MPSVNVRGTAVTLLSVGLVLAFRVEGFEAIGFDPYVGLLDPDIVGEDQMPPSVSGNGLQLIRADRDRLVGVGHADAKGLVLRLFSSDRCRGETS